MVGNPGPNVFYADLIPSGVADCFLRILASESNNLSAGFPADEQYLAAYAHLLLNSE